MPTASIIIATYNRATLLDDCLRHLARQEFSPGDEVLVADNGSTDDTASVVARHAARFPTALSCIPVPTPGKSHAVAAALAIAAGDIVAFTDDDVEVTPGWLPALKGALAHDSVGVAGGPVEPRWEGRVPRWLQLAGRRRLGAPLGLLDFGPAPVPLGERALLGANMAVRRPVLQELGGYATHLGKLRGTLLSGEDHELCVRIQSAGYGARYIPTARVRHRVPPERMRLGYFLQWFYWSGITNATLDAGGAQAQSSFPVPPHLVRQFLGGLAGSLASIVTGQLPGAVDSLLDCAFAAGYAARRSGLVQVAVPGAPRVARSA